MGFCCFVELQRKQDAVSGDADTGCSRRQQGKTFGCGFLGLGVLTGAIRCRREQEEIHGISV